MVMYDVFYKNAVLTIIYILIKIKIYGYVRRLLQKRRTWADVGNKCVNACFLLVLNDKYSVLLSSFCVHFAGN